MKKIFLFTFLLLNSLIQAQINIEMKRQGGVYTLPCIVNGLPMQFIFDTGASDVTISETEADFMWKNGLLNFEDVLWTSKYQIASGDIQVGINIVLRKIDIGGIIIENVLASIVPSKDAPLLLGQSVLGRIGKFQIDPIKSVLTIISYKSNTTDSSVLDIDGNVYKTVKIGNKIWMAENLKTTKYANGESINFVSDNNDWIQTGSAYCFLDNVKKNQKTFGNLYNWYAVMDQRGICPFGWHVPSVAEFNDLEIVLNKKNLQTGALKSIHLWSQPNLEAAGYLGFNVLPGGKRWYKTGLFEFSQIGSYFWTSSSSPQNDRAHYFAFSFDKPKVQKFNFYRGDGFSCRCIQD